MKVAYNQNNIELYPLDGIYEDPCENCIFLPLDKSNCILDEDNFDEIPSCYNTIFIPKPLSDIFICKSNI